MCALANVLGREVCKLHELHKHGKMEEAKLLQHKLILPNTAVGSGGHFCGTCALFARIAQLNHVSQPFHVGHLRVCS